MRILNIIIGIFGILLGIYLFIAGLTIGGYGGLGVVTTYPIIGILCIVFGIRLCLKKKTSIENPSKINVSRAVLLALLIFVIFVVLLETKSLPF